MSFEFELVIFCIMDYFLNDHIIFLGFSYHIVRCPARLCTRNNNIISTSKAHSHAPEPIEREKKMVMNDFKETVLNSTSPRRKIIQDFCSKVQVSLSSVLPNMNSLMSSVNRTRKSHKILEPETDPTSLTDLVITKENIITSSGEPFLVRDYHKIISHERIIVFASSKTLEFLANCSEWYMDGTFDVAPCLFKQLYTIHGKYIVNMVSVFIYKTN